MWEYRLIWTAAAPSWWESAWKNGEALFQRESRELEERPDTYLVLKDRGDVGLKLRGGEEAEFDMKVLHHRQDGWELWEKITFFRWNDLEARRFAVILQRDLPLDAVTSASTPAAGVKKLLDAAGIEWLVQLIEKRRMQARADELLPDFRETMRPQALAELVEFQTQNDAHTVRSICLETMSPAASAPLEPEGALCAGYPEFLIRRLRSEI